MSLHSLNSKSEKYQNINRFLEQKQYDEAIEELLEIIKDSVDNDENDVLMVSLNYLERICDKTSFCTKITLEIIPILLEHREYWVRQKSINIIEIMIRFEEPAIFDGIIEQCEAKLFDDDKNVRVSTVNLIATIFQKTYSHFPDLHEIYARMLNDASWKVRAKALEGILRFVTPDKSPPEKFILTFIDYLYKLFHDADEEIRGLATEVFTRLSLFMDVEKINEHLLLLLNDPDWEIREKAIWIIGEIGHRSFTKHTILFDKLIGLFSDEIMIIQTKTIDAFVKIGKIQSLELFNFLLPYIKTFSESDQNQDALDGISESVIFITIHDMYELLPILINNLRAAHKGIRDTIGNCIIKIYMEKPDKFEEVLFILLQGINPTDWRQRKKIVGLLGDLAYVLHIQTIAVWITINLQNLLEKEEDLDVKEEISSSLDKIRKLFTNIDEDIKEIEKRKEQFYDGLNKFHDMTRKLRVDSEKLIEAKKFNNAEILLEEDGNKISEKLEEYAQVLYNSNFKRFSVDVIQDFKEFKEEIFEHISDIKNVMFNAISDGRSAYLDILQVTILNLRKKIDDVKDRFEGVQNLEKLLTDISLKENPAKIESFLDSISKIQKLLFTLENEIGQTWLSNLEFKEFLKEITLYWVDSKIEIQQYLANIYQKFSLIQSEINDDDKRFYMLKQKITHDFLNNNLQNIIIQAIQSQRDVLERFSTIVSPVYKELQKKKFKDAKNLVELTITNFHSSIENYNREINKVYQDLDKLNGSIKSNKEIKQYLTNWDQVKNDLLNQIHTFKSEIQQDIFTEELKDYLKYMNPISMQQLSIEFNIPLEDLKKNVFNLIKNHIILAEIRDDELIQPERPVGEFLLNFHRKIEIIGSKIIFNLRVYNPTKFFINEIELNFLFPEFLKFIPDESDPTDISIQEFEPEAIRIIQWQFRIEKSMEKKYELNRWLLNVNYRNPFKKMKTIQKEMEIII